MNNEISNEIEHITSIQSENLKENKNNNNGTDYQFISSNGNQKINRGGKRLTVHNFYKIKTEKYLESLKLKQEQMTTESDQLANSFEAPNTCDTSSQILQNEFETNTRHQNNNNSTTQFYKGKVLELVEKYSKKEEKQQTNSNNSQLNTCIQENDQINKKQEEINEYQDNQNQEQTSLWNDEYQQAIKIKTFQENLKIEQFIQPQLIICANSEQVLANDENTQNIIKEQEQSKIENNQDQQIDQLNETENIQFQNQEEEQELILQSQYQNNDDANLLAKEQQTQSENQQELEKSLKSQYQNEKDEKQQPQQIDKEIDELKEFVIQNLNQKNEITTSQTVSALKGNRRNLSQNKMQKQERQVQFPNHVDDDEELKRKNLIFNQNEGIKLDLSKLNSINKQDQRKRRAETQSANSKRSIRSNWTTKTFKEKAEEVAVPAVGTAVVGSLGMILAQNVLKGKSKLIGLVPALACSAYYYYKIKKQNEVEVEVEEELEDEEDLNSDDEQEEDSTKVYQ